MHHYIPHKNVHIGQMCLGWEQESKKQEKGPVFWTSAYICERNISLQLNIEQLDLLLLLKLL